jgi:dephospho-CoA kinase
MIIAISGKIGSGKDTVGKIIQYLTRDYVYIDYSFEQYFNLNTTKTFQIKKFADTLKDIVCLLIGCTREQLEDNDFKNSKLGKEWKQKYIQLKVKNGIYTYVWNKEFEERLKYKNREYIIVEDTELLTVRKMLQLVGTDCMRNILNENVWVNSLMNEYKVTYKYRLVNPMDRECSPEERVPNSETYPNWIITDTRFENELEAIKSRGGISIRVNRLLSEGNRPYVELHPSETALDNAEFNYIIDNNGTIEELIEKVKVILIKEKII